ncbi:MAG: hypothetical protein HXS52_14205 [Theionarchaea archaeon]|nr:hypothetical protein [Theionarchaea archaeon]MBU7039077.1 hypothetical protein [Theionarchaea archaeon]
MNLLARSIIIALLVFILFVPKISEQHLDEGTHLIIVEVVLDTIDLISSDEVDYDDDPDDGDDIRFYSKFAQAGHSSQECMIAFPDDLYEGYYKKDYEELKKGNFKDQDDSHIVVGQIVYLHVECDPPEPFNYEIHIWDDDWYSPDGICQMIKDALELEFLPKEARIWGGLATGLGSVFREIKGSSDNYSSSVVINKVVTETTRHTEQTTLSCCNDLDWKVGDPGARVNFTIKIENFEDLKCRTNGCPNIEAYRKLVQSKIDQLALEEELKRLLKRDFNVMHDSIEQGKMEEAREEIDNFREEIYDNGTIDYNTAVILEILAGKYLDFTPTIGCDPPVYQNIVAFPTPERFLGSDLNSDGDTNDTILRYKNLFTGEIVNTGLVASGAHHSIDIHENIIAFVGEGSHIQYYDTRTNTFIETGTTGSHPSIHEGIITFVSKNTIHYFNLETQTLVDTDISGSNPTVYDNLIVFHAFNPEPTIWAYDVHTGTAVNTGLTGRDPVLYETVIAFETPESSAGEDLNGDNDLNDWVVRYYDLNDQILTNTGAVGRSPALHGDRIVFATPEGDVAQDLNGDGKILGSVIRYYDLESGRVVNTQKLGTEPDIYDDTIAFYFFEHWVGRDFNGDGDQAEPIVGIHQISVKKMGTTNTASLFLILLLAGSVAAYLERRK